MFYNKKYRDKKEEYNSLIKKLLFDLLKQSEIGSIQKILLLGTVNYSESDVEIFKKILTNEDFDFFFKLREVNLNNNLFEVFIIQNTSNNYFFVGIFNPVELWANEELLFIKKIENQIVEKLNGKEIFLLSGNINS